MAKKSAKKKTKNSDREIRACPYCGSSNLKGGISKNTPFIEEYPVRYCCNTCGGYSLSITFDTEEDYKKFKKFKDKELKSKSFEKTFAEHPELRTPTMPFFYPEASLVLSVGTLLAYAIICFSFLKNSKPNNFLLILALMPGILLAIVFLVTSIKILKQKNKKI